MEEVSPWSNLEPLMRKEVAFRPLHRPQGWHLGAVPFLLFYSSRALIGEENEQWLRYKAESSIWPTTFYLLSLYVHPVFIPDV